MGTTQAGPEHSGPGKLETGEKDNSYTKKHPKSEEASGSDRAISVGSTVTGGGGLQLRRIGSSASIGG